MFAHLRSLQSTYATVATVATNMRDHCRNQRPLLTGLDLSNPTVAGMLAEIHMREFACMMRTLKQVNWVASKYHEHAFDNTDAYIEGQLPSQTHEMNAEQRHAAQLLLGVGNSYSEINVALRILDSGSFQAAMECSPEMCAKLSQQFSANASMAEDAFDRLNHMTKHVWSLVNLLALSNLFRFADHIILPNPEDSIFIPYIPTQAHAQSESKSDKSEADADAESKSDAASCEFPGAPVLELEDPESESESDNDDEANSTYWLKTVADWTAANRINKSEMNTPQEQRTCFKEIAEMLADEKITTEQACSMIEELRNAGITADAMDAQNEQEKGFKEIAELLADGKITTEEACGLFTEWMTEL